MYILGVTNVAVVRSIPVPVTPINVYVGHPFLYFQTPISISVRTGIGFIMTRTVGATRTYPTCDSSIVSMATHYNATFSLKVHKYATFIWYMTRKTSFLCQVPWCTVSSSCKLPLEKPPTFCAERADVLHLWILRT